MGEVSGVVGMAPAGPVLKHKGMERSVLRPGARGGRFRAVVTADLQIVAREFAGGGYKDSHAFPLEVNVVAQVSLRVPFLFVNTKQLNAVGNNQHP